jgi:hypothetical protein
MTNNRESWLEAALVLLGPLFAAANMTLPEKLHVSVGFPSKMALSSRKQRIGECWAGRVSADGTAHIFISPVLDNPVEALATLVHEAIHAIIGTEHGHKAPFVKAMNAIGLTGKPTATEAGETLRVALEALLEKLGPYPQPKFNATELQKEIDKKKQTTRLLKASCAQGGEAPYTVRVTRVHLDKHGSPWCPCHQQAMAVEGWPSEDDNEEESGE